MTTNAETRRLAAEYPKGTVILYHGPTGNRSGLVVKAERGQLVVLTPALAARARKKDWGVRVPTPVTERVTRRDVIEISTRHTRRARA